MATIELPKDAEGREIPRNTWAMYDINGKKVHITSFTYKCDTLGLWAQWKVFSPDIRGEKDGMLPADSLYLTPPDTWEKLEEDLCRGADALNYEACDFFGKSTRACSSCIADKDETCERVAMRDILTRIRNLRGED